jgi:hypothetical protein
MLLWLAVASVLASSAFTEPLKAYEHKLVDICGVRDLLEANCNGATYIDTCDMCVHDAVKVACPAIDPPDCIALVKYWSKVSPYPSVFIYQQKNVKKVKKKISQ